MDRELRDLERRVDADPLDATARRTFRRGLQRYFHGTDNVTYAREILSNPGKTTSSKEAYKAARLFMTQCHPYQFTGLLGIARVEGQRALVLHEPGRKPVIITDRDLQEYNQQHHSYHPKNISHVTFADDEKGGAIAITSAFNYTLTRQINDMAISAPYSIKQVPYPKALADIEFFKQHKEMRRTFMDDDYPADWCRMWHGFEGLDLEYNYHIEDGKDQQEGDRMFYEGDRNAPLTVGNTQVGNSGLLLPDNSRYLRGENRVEKESDLIRQFSGPYQMMTELPLHACNHIRKAFHKIRKQKEKKQQGKFKVNVYAISAQQAVENFFNVA